MDTKHSHDFEAHCNRHETTETSRLVREALTDARYGMAVIPVARALPLSSGDYGLARCRVENARATVASEPEAARYEVSMVARSIEKWAENAAAV
mgnify:CR=1 FL=1